MTRCCHVLFAIMQEKRRISHEKNNVLLTSEIFGFPIISPLGFVLVLITNSPSIFI